VARSTGATGGAKAVGPDLKTRPGLAGGGGGFSRDHSACFFSSIVTACFMVFGPNHDYSPSRGGPEEGSGRAREGGLGTPPWDESSLPRRGKGRAFSRQNPRRGSKKGRRATKAAPFRSVVNWMDFFGGGLRRAAPGGFARSGAADGRGEGGSACWQDLRPPIGKPGSGLVFGPEIEELTKTLSAPRDCPPPGCFTEGTNRRESSRKAWVLQPEGR